MQQDLCMPEEVYIPVLHLGAVLARRQPRTRHFDIGPGMETDL